MNGQTPRYASYSQRALQARILSGDDGYPEPRNTAPQATREPSREPSRERITFQKVTTTERIAVGMVVLLAVIAATVLGLALSGTFGSDGSTPGHPSSCSWQYGYGYNATGTYGYGFHYTCQ